MSHVSVPFTFVVGELIRASRTNLNNKTLADAINAEEIARITEDLTFFKLDGSRQLDSQAIIRWAARTSGIEIAAMRLIVGQNRYELLIPTLTDSLIWQIADSNTGISLSFLELSLSEASLAVGSRSNPNGRIKIQADSCFVDGNLNVGEFSSTGKIRFRGRFDGDPPNLQEADIWYDNTIKALRMFNGSETVTIG